MLLLKVLIIKSTTEATVNVAFEIFPAKPAACGRCNRTALAVRSRKRPATPALKRFLRLKKVFRVGQK